MKQYGPFDMDNADHVKILGPFMVALTKELGELDLA